MPRPTPPTTKPAPGFDRPLGGRPDTGRPEIGRPGEGGSGTRPGGGGRPDTGRPEIGRPGEGGSGTRPGGGGRPSTGRPEIGRPGEGGSGTRPGGGGRPDFGGGQGGNWGQGSGGRPNYGNRPGGGSSWVIGRPGNNNNNNWTNITNNIVNNNTNVNIGINNNFVNRPAWDRPYYRPSGWGWGGGYVNVPWHQSWYYNGINSHYHSWYNGAWQGYWGSDWYAPVGLVAAGWGLNSLFASAARPVVYANPYYVEPAITAASPWDYSQPVVVNNYLNSTADGGAAGGVQTAAGINEPPAAALTNLDRGLERFRAGSYSAALSSFDAALRQMPGDAVAHELRALTLFALQRYTESAAALNSLLVSAPGMDWTTLSGLYENTDLYTEQLRVLEEHTRRQPDDAAGYFVLAYHYLVIGAKDEAIGALREVVRIQPDDLTARHMLQALDPESLPAPEAVRSAGEASATATPPSPPSAAGNQPRQPAADLDLGDGESVPSTDLVGRWRAEAQGTSIELTIDEEGAFEWVATQPDSTVIRLSGLLEAAADRLVLESQTQGSMAGGVVSRGNDAWRFQPLEVDDPAAGIEFSRQP
jgi:tetratricopeptide (TPR) repeat protein